MRTIFNFLGPLTNPAGATRQVIGVSDPAFLDVIAGALARLGARKALVVSSADGLDELSTCGRDPRRRGRRRRRCARYDVTPEDVGLRARGLRGRRGRPARRPTRATTRRILAGEPGPARDLAVLNAGAAIYAAGRAPTAWSGGVRAAEAAIDDGARRARRSTGSSSSRVSWRRT